MNLLKPSLTLILIALAPFLGAAKTQSINSSTLAPRSEATQLTDRGSRAIRGDYNNHPRPTAESNQQKTARIEPKNDDKKTPIVDVRKDRWDYILICFTILFTGGLVVVGGLQVKWLKKQTQISTLSLKIARQSIEVSRLALQINRPFLLVTELANLTEQRDPSPFKFIVEADVALRNFGTGPADILDYIVEAEIYNIPPPDPDPDYDTIKANTLNDSLVAANETVADRIHAIIALDGPEYESVMREQKRIAIHGRIRYRGTGPGQVYWTRFFWWHFPDAPKLARALTKRLNDHT